MGNLTVRYSTFSNNHGGAIVADGPDMVIANSTISGNTSDSSWPIISWGQAHNGRDGAIIESTISGNTASTSTIVAVEALEGFGSMSIVNSTIAFNQASESCDEATVSVGEGPTLMDSTIISNNSCDGGPQDSVGGTFFTEDPVLVGANNLITTPARLALPADTITTDPRLAPLADNGGPTKTHALLDSSPAIDMGNNEAGLEFDQRGKGYPRVKAGQADIGAYEH